MAAIAIRLHLDERRPATAARSLDRRDRVRVDRLDVLSIAAPRAIGMPAPTIAFAPMLPLLKSMRCIDPPTPFAHPVARPMSSAKATSGSIPNARASP